MFIIFFTIFREAAAVRNLLQAQSLYHEVTTGAKVEVPDRISSRESVEGKG